MVIGLAKTLRRTVNRQLQPIFFETLVKRIGTRGEISDTREMFNYMARANLGVISAIQSRAELIPALELVKRTPPRTVMEIGTANGGTLFILTRIARSDATIVSLDLPGGLWGGGYTDARVPLYKAFALPHQKLHLLREDSHQPEALEHTRDAFAGQTIDFLFIDGDHSYEGVKQDFEMYSPLVTPGGLIGFHDIAYTEGVRRWWAEIKPQFAETHEFIAPSAPVYGIGLIRTPST